VAQRELSIGRVEFIPSSAAWTPVNSQFPSFPQLRPVENFILRQFYEQGESYSKIAKKLRKKKSFVKTAISRTRMKIGAFSSMVE
jgi:hypothetical protein